MPISTPKMPHLSINLLQPRLPPSHSPCDDEPPPHHSQEKNRTTVSRQCDEARLQEGLPELRRERVRLVHNISARRLSCPDRTPPAQCRCHCEWRTAGARIVDRRFPEPNRALRELTMSNGTWEAFSSSGRHGGAFLSSTSGALASNVLAAAAEAAV